MGTVSTTRWALKPVEVACEWVEFIGADRNTPDFGLAEINGQRYAVGRGLVGRGLDGSYYTLLAVGSEADGPQARYYQLPADLSSCDCPDATFRPDRPGGCKHRRALAKLLAERPEAAAK